MKKGTVIALIIAVLLIAFIPLFLLKDAQFGGSDDAGSNVVEEVDAGYEAWAAPVLEKIIGGRASRGSGEYAVLRADRHRSRNSGLLYGPVRRTEKTGPGRVAPRPKGRKCLHDYHRQAVL